jgi:hypothetical protein
MKTGGSNLPLLILVWLDSPAPSWVRVKLAKHFRSLFLFPRLAVQGYFRGDYQSARPDTELFVSVSLPLTTCET